MTTLNSYFHTLPDPACPERLVDETLVALTLVRTRARERRRAGFYLALSVGLWLVALVVAGSALIQAEFWTILSLLFSDFSLVVPVMEDFVSSLLETLPTLPLLFVLAPLPFLFWTAASWLSVEDRNSPDTLFQPNVLAASRGAR